MKFILKVEQLENEILVIKESSLNMLVVYDNIISYLRNVMDAYRGEIYRREFQTTQEEIDFFKIHKQIPQSQLIYYLQLRALELQFPYYNKSRKKQQLKKIEKINKFFHLHLEFSKYMEMDQQHLDVQYFTRSFLGQNEITSQGNHQIDPRFNTSHDILLSKYKVYKMLMPKLMSEVIKSNELQVSTTGIKLKWTASKVALIELLYALQVNCSINNGRTELITIASVFEDLFEIKLDNIYKTFSEIKSRKVSRTKFLDELTWQFEQKMKGDEAL